MAIVFHRCWSSFTSHYGYCCWAVAVVVEMCHEQFIMLFLFQFCNIILHFFFLINPNLSLKSQEQRQSCFFCLYGLCFKNNGGCANPITWLQITNSYDVMHFDLVQITHFQKSGLGFLINSYAFWILFTFLHILLLFIYDRPLSTRSTWWSDGRVEQLKLEMSALM